MLHGNSRMTMWMIEKVENPYSETSEHVTYEITEGWFEDGAS